MRPRAAPPRLLTVNPGSSSIRLHLFELGDRTPRLLGSLQAPRRPGREARRLARFVGDSGMPQFVAHRVVHPGAELRGDCALDARVERALRAAVPLAPLHLPDTLAWVEVVRRLAGARCRQLAIFDSSFFATLPPEASTYGLPAALARRHGIRRIGFHGLAHAARVRHWQQLHPGRRLPRRIVSLQLGAGCSAAAILDGRAIDTSMGLTPAEGLLMATRAGDIDSGALLHLQREAGMSARQLDELLNRRSGLLGMAGTADLRRLLARDDSNARLAVAVYCYRARKYIGAYAAALGGLDCVLIGGGAGEHSAAMRARLLSGLDWLALRIDRDRNRAAAGAARISAPSSRVAAWVMPADEAGEIARRARALLAPPRA